MSWYIRTTFANVYETASFSSQMVTQGIIWEKIQILEEQADWLKIKLPDGYEGWSQRFSLIEADAVTVGKMQNKHRLIIHEPNTIIKSFKDGASERIALAAWSAAFPLIEEKSYWKKVLLPDGRDGWLQYEKLPEIPLRELLIETGRKIVGTAYQWGGKTEYGTDCSGFTQSVFNIHGIRLPRDASQQIKVLKEYPISKNDSQPGDLAFFQNETKRVTHVAMMTGPNRFIHSSGEVKLNSFDPADNDYSAKLDAMLEGVYSVESLLSQTKNK